MNSSPDCKTPRLELAVMVQPTGEQTAGIEFELLRTYPWCVALTAAHPFARLKSISLEKLAAEPLVGLRRKDYSEYHRILDRIFASISAKPRIAVECDSASSLITEVEAGRGIALATTVFKLVAGKRLLYRPLTGTTEAESVGIARATKGDVTPAGEKFCEILRRTSSESEHKRVSYNRAAYLSSPWTHQNMPMPNECAGAYGTDKDRFVKHTFVLTRVLLSSVGP